jgi:membrane-bound lytic murein transglycosylase MltF
MKPTKELIDLVVAKFEEVFLDVAYACAIIEHESNWNPKARSPGGATDDRRGGA